MIAFLALASAQVVPSANVQHFWPTGGSQGFATVPSARQLPGKGVGVDLVLNYAHRPLQRTVVVDGEPARESGAIDSLFAGHLRLAYGLIDQLELAVDAPLAQLVGTGPGLVELGGQDRSFAMGDVNLSLALRPFDESLLGVALVPFLTLPTGSRAAFLSHGVPTYGARLVLSKTIAPIHVAANVGYRSMRSGGYIGERVGVDDAVLFGAGVGFDLVPDSVRFNLEFTGHAIVGPAKAAALPTALQASLHTPAELLADVRWTSPGGVSLLAGGGPGVSSAPGTPVFRVFAGLGYHTPKDRDSDGDGIIDRVDACKHEPEDIDTFEDADGCPDPDNDADGILDVNDRCPLEPEDLDGFQDEDGCPDLDNDRDGIPDLTDQCPLLPEDLDGIDDLDGCPDYSSLAVDTDGDGILDTVDNCVSQPEDFDGFQDEDGCPDPDNDADTILDPVDKCPNEPENFNGVDDTDGCPEASRVVLTQDRIMILEKVLFVTGKAQIVEASYPLLMEVLDTLVKNPQVARVKIEGHTDSRGSDRYNLDLSQKRADAILAFLVDRGVEASRLEAEGFGEFSPLFPNDSPENMENNRRVEFHVLQTTPTVPATP